MQQFGKSQLYILGVMACTHSLLAQELWLKPDEPPPMSSPVPQLLAQSAIGNAQPTDPQQIPPPISAPSHRQRAAIPHGHLASSESRAIPDAVPHQTDLRSLPLPPPTKEHAAESDSGAVTGGSALFTVMSSLAIVLGLFFGVVWLSRRALPKSAGGLSSDVVEVLGRTAMGNRQTLQLIRVGNRLLLVSVTSTGANTLTEVTDPHEVQELLDRCNGVSSEPTSNSFRDVLLQLGRNSNAAAQTGLT